MKINILSKIPMIKPPFFAPLEAVLSDIALMASEVLFSGIRSLIKIFMKIPVTIVTTKNTISAINNLLVLSKLYSYTLIKLFNPKITKAIIKK